MSQPREPSARRLARSGPATQNIDPEGRVSHGMPSLPLLVLLLTAPPIAPRPARPAASAARLVSTRTESVSAVDRSAAQRFGWLDATRPQARPLPRPLEAEALVDLRRVPGEDMARAGHWIDALPFKVDVQDGTIWVALRLRGL